MNNPNRTATRFNRNLLSCALAACLAMAAPAMAQSTAATLRGQAAAGATVTVTYPNGLVPMTSLTLRFYSTLAPLTSAQHVVRIRQMQLRTCA